MAYKSTDKDKKRLRSNFFSLSVLQGANMILPLITLPYLVRVLGVENFGLVSFALAIIMYFDIFINFGFDLSATRKISIHRKDLKKTSQIFLAILIIKFTLFLVSFVVLTLLIISIQRLNNHAMLYYATFSMLFGNVLFPIWFFQGMERMKYITYINISTRVIFTVLIFVLVQDSSDYIYVPILTSLASILSGVFSIWLIFRLFNVQLHLPCKQIIFSQLKDSYHFFLSSAANNGSRYYATMMIGLTFGNIAVGYYVMAEKLFYAFLTLPSVVSQTLYPYMSRTKNIELFKKIFLIVLGVAVILLIPIMYFEQLLLILVFDAQHDVLSNLFLILFSGAFFATMNTLINYPLLAAFGYTTYANNSQIIASIIFIIMVTVSALVFRELYLIALSVALYPLISLIISSSYVAKTKILTE